MYLPSLSWWEDGSVNRQIMLVTDGWRVNVFDYYGLYEIVTQSQRTPVPHLVKREQRLQENVMKGTGFFIRLGSRHFSATSKRNACYTCRSFSLFLNQIYTVVNISVFTMYRFYAVIYVTHKQCVWGEVWNKTYNYIQIYFKILF